VVAEHPYETTCPWFFKLIVLIMVNTFTKSIQEFLSVVAYFISTSSHFHGYGANIDPQDQGMKLSHLYLRFFKCGF